METDILKWIAVIAGCTAFPLAVMWLGNRLHMRQQAKIAREEDERIRNAPWMWEYSAYGQYQDFHYSRRRSDDRVERHPNNQPCKCPNAAEYGGTWQR